MNKFLLAVILCLSFVSVFGQYQEPEIFSNDIIDSFTYKAYTNLSEFYNIKNNIELRSNQLSLLISDPSKFNQTYQNNFQFTVKPDNIGNNPYDTSKWDKSVFAESITKIDETTYSEFNKVITNTLPSVSDQLSIIKSHFSDLNRDKEKIIKENKKINPLKQSRSLNLINYFLNEISVADQSINKIKILNSKIISTISNKNLVKTPIVNRKAEKIINKTEPRKTKKIPKSNIVETNNNLQKIYYKDYGAVNRTVLVLDKTVSPVIKKNSMDISILLQKTDCSKTEYKEYIESDVIRNYDVEQKGNLSIVTINTQNTPHYLVTKFPGEEYKIVLDVFKTMNPKLTEDLYSFAEFYKTVGFERKALKFFAKWDKNKPQNTNGYYAYGELLAKRGRVNSAILMLNKVNMEDENYNDAQTLLLSLNRKKIKTNDIKSEKIEKPKVIAKRINKEINKDFSEESNSLYSLYQNYFNQSNDINLHRLMTGIAAKTIKNYDEAQKILLKIEDSSPYILNMYKEMTEISEALGDEENAQLYRSLTVPENEKKEKKVGLFSYPIPLWLTIVAILFVTFLTAMFIIIYYKRKMENMISLSDSKFSLDDVTYHEDRIKEAYSKNNDESENQFKEEKAVEKEEDLSEEEELFTNVDKNMVKEIPIEETFDNEELIEELNLDEEKLNEEDEFNLEFDKDSLEKEFQNFVDDSPSDIDDFDFDDPPMVNENLSLQEEEELLESEKEALFGKSEDNEINDIGLSSDNRQKIIKKLMNDGWEIEEIAKELQISQREVEIITKMQ